MAIKFIDTHNSNFSVVLAEDHSKSQKFAAQQLIKFVKKTTRVEMSLKVSTKVPKKAIILGDHPFIKENYPNIDFSHLGEEGYQWEFEENYIIIAGSKKRGTLYGVCSFLEEFLGVRFYDPEFFLIPKHESIELPEISKEKTPDFEYRMVTYINLLDPDFSFYQKVNMNPFAEDIHGGSAGKLSTGLMTHTFQKLVPWKKYYEDHPEYFALIDGERVGGPMSQLCLSNPDVVEIATKNVLKWFRQDPDLMSVGIVPNDVDGYCECKD